MARRLMISRFLSGVISVISGVISVISGVISVISPLMYEISRSVGPLKSLNR